jgi:hypothetical protein
MAHPDREEAYDALFEKLLRTTFSQTELMSTIMEKI